MLIIRPDDHITSEPLEDDEMRQIQRICGGSIGNVILVPGIELWCLDDFDDDGRFNTIATSLAGVPICGSVCITRYDNHGNTIDLSQDDTRRLIEGLRASGLVAGW